MNKTNQPAVPATNTLYDDLKTIVKKRSTAKKKSQTAPKRPGKATSKAAMKMKHAEADEKDAALSAGSPLSPLLYDGAHGDPSSEVDHVERTYVEMLIFSMAEKQYAFRVADAIIERLKKN